MVKSNSTIIAALVLISATVPANAMWRSFASRVGSWSNAKKATSLLKVSTAIYVTCVLAYDFYSYEEPKKEKPRIH